MGVKTNSQAQLGYDLHNINSSFEIQNMNSSFDVGNDPLYNSYKLIPRHMSEYSISSGEQMYDPNHFNSFQNYTKSQG